MSDTVKTGDRVLVIGRYNKHITTIERETTTQLITVEGGRYRKKNLRKVGEDGWSSTHLQRLTPELEAQFREQVLNQKLNRMLTDQKFLDKLQHMSIEFKQNLVDSVTNNGETK